MQNNFGPMHLQADVRPQKSLNVPTYITFLILHCITCHEIIVPLKIIFVPIVQSSGCETKVVRPYYSTIFPNSHLYLGFHNILISPCSECGMVFVIWIISLPFVCPMKADRYPLRSEFYTISWLYLVLWSVQALIVCNPSLYQANSPHYYFKCDRWL